MKKIIIVSIASVLTIAVAIVCILIIISAKTTIDRSESYTKAMEEFHEVVNSDSPDKAKKMKELAGDIKSEGDYARVEKAVKEYMCDVIIPFEEAASVQNDGIYTTSISIELLQNDAPDFAKPYATMATMEEKLDGIQKVVDTLFEREAAMKYLDGDLDDSYISLFEEEANDIYNDPDFKQSYVDYIETLRTITFHYRNILDFLVANNGNWHLEDGAIAFKTTQLTDQYNNLANELKSISDN